MPNLTKLNANFPSKACARVKHAYAGAVYSSFLIEITLLFIFYLFLNSIV